jgi:hypothetical protein
MGNDDYEHPFWSERHLFHKEEKDSLALSKIKIFHYQRIKGKEIGEIVIKYFFLKRKGDRSIFL